MSKALEVEDADMGFRLQGICAPACPASQEDLRVRSSERVEVPPNPRPLAWRSFMSLSLQTRPCRLPAAEDGFQNTSAT